MYLFIKANKYLIILLSIVITTTACNNTRYLYKGETLYDGSTIQINDSDYSKSTKSVLKEELQTIITPKRNKKFATMRLKLSFYNLAGKPHSDKGLRNWIKTKLGEPPVLGSSFDPLYNQKIISNYLLNRGYYNNQVVGTKNIDHQLTTGHFEIVLGNQYQYNKIDFSPSDSSKLAKAISLQANGSLLRKGDYYNLDIIKAERERINLALKKQGFFYFSPDYLIVYIDSSIGNNLINAKVALRYDIIPQKAYKQYKIRNIEIYPNYQFTANANSVLNRWISMLKNDTLHYKTLDIIQRNKTYRPQLFREVITYDSGDTYNPIAQNNSLSRLVNLGVFKFVKNEYVPVQDTGNSLFKNLLQSNAAYAYLLNSGLADTNSNYLDVHYYLTQQPHQQLSGEFGGFTQNDSRAGSKASISWQNRNIFRGAELLKLKITGGFEIQYGNGAKSLPNTYNAGVDVSLNIPRLFTPFFNIPTSNQFIPRTLATISYNYYLRNTLYKIKTFGASLSYNWKRTPKEEHKFAPINITYVHTDTFSTVSKYDYNLSNLLFDGIIFGPTYQYTFNTQASGQQRKNNFYFDGLIDLSGNIVGLIQKTNINEPPKKILDAKYAQYVKFQADYRYYRKLNPKGTSTLATRLMAGFGLPYGNSYTLPNIKQFFSGGSSSLRGFPARLVGPGTYNGEYLGDSVKYLETLGDIKLEANIEYRTKLYQFIDGALFVDAGNIWLLRDNPAFPGGKFNSDFLNQMAVDAGVGIRFDLSILVLRFDFGIPLRKPWLPQGQRWVINQIDAGSIKWWGNNMVMNLAIGYPF